MNWIEKLDRHFEEILAASLLGIITCLLFLQVVFRYFINLPLDWTEELARYLFVDFVYISASLGSVCSMHGGSLPGDRAVASNFPDVRQLDEVNDHGGNCDKWYHIIEILYLKKQEVD